MASFTTFLSAELLDHVFLDNAYTAPTTVYLCLFTADPGEAGALTNELDQSADYTSGYTRQAITFGAPASDAVRNTGVLTFGPIVTTDAIAITHVAIIDVVTLATGNVLSKGAVTVSKDIANGDSATIAINNLTQSLV